MHLLAIFVATIVGIILKPLPMGAVAMVGIAATAITKTLTITQALSGFGNRVIWLIVLAFFISRGFIKTGLGARIAYLFMALLGKKSLGLGYGLVATDLVLAPAIPSNTARAGGVVFPILRSVAEAYGSRPDDGTAKTDGSLPHRGGLPGNGHHQRHVPDRHGGEPSGGGACFGSGGRGDLGGLGRGRNRSRGW